MSGNVTFKPKCYVFVCAGCGLLASSGRSDAITCSTACRVMAHRTGNIKRLRAIAEMMDVTTAGIQQWAAINNLAPEIGDEVSSGKRRKIDDEVRRIVWARFMERVRQALEAAP